MFENLFSQPGFWSKPGPSCDVVLSTRVRLARNLASLRFPHYQEESEINLLKSVIQRFVSDSKYGDSISMIDLGAINPGDKRFLRERNIITSEMESSRNCFVVINRDEQFVIMVNEEDHLRIQVIRPGFQVMETYRTADEIDDEMNRFISYAYSDELGYLTTCPSNLGTGLRVSVMVHLPALTISRSIQDVTRIINSYGADMKGTAGEDTRTVGCMYQISNHASLGKSEVDILEGMDEVAGICIEMESESRDEYLSQHRVQLEDRICRSYGTLRHSRILSYPESVDHLSNIRLGVILSILKNIDLQRINDLMINVQWSHLQKRFGTKFASGLECDSLRAEYVRSQISASEL